MIRRRMHLCLACAVIVVSSIAQTARAAEPVRLILDTDIGNDVDDLFALAMIHALESRSEVHLLAVTITKDNRYAAPFVSLVNTYYGRPQIPIGVVHHGKTPEDSPMLRVMAQNTAVYPHAILSQPEDAVALLRRMLAAQPDHSVTLAQIGFSTNLARLLDSPGGRELVIAKVKLLCLMAGNFSKPQPEFNVYIDPDSAKILFDRWPTPMIFSPFELGLQVTFPWSALDRDFDYTPHNPVPEGFRLYTAGKPQDRPNWDSTAVLEAIRPDRGYFDLSAPGRVSLGTKSTTTFTPDPGGKCRYLIIKPDQVARVREVIETLVSEPPRGR
ncbi:MAG TPA: nucleoside hydrolase [Bryobacteraceae bacterium]|nr:nucleoside hydrolase [Bryobacteraceae bacterium]